MFVLCRVGLGWVGFYVLMRYREILIALASLEDRAVHAAADGIGLRDLLQLPVCCGVVRR